MVKAYRFEVDGFFGTVSTLADLKAEVGGLKRRYPDIVGKVCRIFVGEDHGDCYVFAKGSVEKIVEAA